MTFYSAVGSFNSPTGSPYTNTVSGLGFTPVAVIFWANGSTSTGWTAQAAFAFGFAANNAGTMQAGYITTNDRDAQTTVASERRWAYATGSTAACIGMTNYNSTVEAEGYVTFSSGQFVVTWGTHVTAYTIHYLVLGGTDITGAGVASWAGATTTGNHAAVTNLGFQPDLVLHAGTEDTSASPHSTTHSIHCLGAMDRAGNQWAKYGFNSGAKPTVTGRVQRDDACIVTTNVTTSITTQASFISMDTSGFTLNWSLATSAFRYISLCLKGGAYQVGDWYKTNAVTSAGGSVAYDLLTGITPTAVLVASDSDATNSITEVTGAREMIGASDGTNFHVAGITEQTAVSTTVCKQFQYTSESLLTSNNDTSTTESLGTVGDFATGQFLPAWTTNDANSPQICYVAFGGVVTDVDGATTTYCPVEYNTWPVANNLIDNKGWLGCAYSALTADNDYSLLSSGATAFKLNDTTDYIKPTSRINNLRGHTLEWLIYYDAANDPNDPHIYFKAGYEYEVYIDHVNRWVCVYRTDAAYTGILYTTPTNCVATNNWYFVQISWASRITSNLPVIYINGVSQTVTRSATPAATWLDDSASDVYLSPPTSVEIPLIGSIALFRLHYLPFAAAELTANYNASKWRYTAAIWTQTVVPNCTTASSAPTVGVSRTETVVPTCTTASSASTLAISTSRTETTVPNCTTASSTPSLAIARTQTIVPNCTTTSSASTTGITSSPTSPTCTTTSSAPPHVILTNFTETTVPTCTTASSAPPHVILTNFNETTVPDCTTDATHTATPNITVTETTVPNCTTASLAPTVSVPSNVTWNQTLVPGCSTTVGTLVVFAISPWDETIVPDCTTASSAPFVGITTNPWSQFFTPGCVTATNVVAPDIGVQEIIIPDCTTYSMAPAVVIAYFPKQGPIVRVSGGTIPETDVRIPSPMPTTYKRMYGTILGGILD